MRESVRMKHRARKRFGQNFLVDTNTVAAIIHAIHPRPGDAIIEIGPGLGALTRPLLAAAGRLRAIEIDRDLAVSLARQCGPALTLFSSDALEFDFAACGDELRIVGNLPYYISTPLLFHIARFADRIRDIHVMLQREVVERMVAPPAAGNYGRLSVMLQYRFELEHMLDVPASAFDPSPAVESAVVRLTPRSSMRARAHDEETFARVVTSAFSQRRKTLRNSLRGWMGEADFAAAHIIPTARAQELSVADFVALADFVSARHGH